MCARLTWEGTGWEPRGLRPGGCPPGSAGVREPDPGMPQVPTCKLDVIKILNDVLQKTPTRRWEDRTEENIRKIKYLMGDLYLEYIK